MHDWLHEGRADWGREGWEVDGTNTNAALHAMWNWGQVE